ncbi:MAG: glycosyltransferase, partial [Rhodothermia bacterium]|nr:glycosyltransferase [Rhodothermia bacterium]
MEPKVSVCLRTYNQVDFVSDAIESVLNQTTSFGFELVVGDDGSSDGTLDRIARYRRQYPAIIRLLPSETRLGGRRNLVRSIAACRGDYIAMLDGDDFWTSDQKLQLQSDLLDAFPEISACG